jgi:hypothetical protein
MVGLSIHRKSVRRGGLDYDDPRQHAPARCAFAGHHLRPKETVQIDLTMKPEEEILHFAVSDKALEIAAGSAKEMANFTLGSCTNITVCPH